MPLCAKLSANLANGGCFCQSGSAKEGATAARQDDRGKILLPLSFCERGFAGRHQVSNEIRGLLLGQRLEQTFRHHRELGLGH